MSAPARACVSASLASRSRVASLSTSSPTSTPQWPWSVYSHRQTSVITTRSGTALLIAAHGALHDAVVAVGLRAGGVLLLRNAEQDHRRDAEIAHRAALLHRRDRPTAAPRRASSRPGSTTPEPGTTNSGRMSWSTLSRVSRTMRRKRFVAPQAPRSVGGEFHRPSPSDCPLRAAGGPPAAERASSPGTSGEPALRLRRLGGEVRQDRRR